MARAPKVDISERTRGGRPTAHAARPVSGASWRKIAAASWSRPVDPQIYGDLEIDAERLLDFVARAREESGVHVTVTHLVGRALAHALAQNPDCNVRLYRGGFVRRESVDIFFAAAIGGGAELSGVKIVAADTKSVVEVAEELTARVERLRSGRDAELGQTKRVLASTPAWLLRHGLRVATWLVADRGVDLERYGLPRDAFGSAIVSSVAGFSAERAYGPLSPWYRIPVLALVSEVRPRPAVVDGEVAVRPILPVTATLDHRYLDGAHAGRLVRAVRGYLEDPEAVEETLLRRGA